MGEQQKQALVRQREARRVPGQRGEVQGRDEVHPVQALGDIGSYGKRQRTAEVPHDRPVHVR
ncbi:hypothetical protein GCM10027091_66380 [Streptomyces daliensis]